MRPKGRVGIVCCAIFIVAGAASSAGAVSQITTTKGLHGETLSASPTTLGQSGSVTVQGNHFDETVGLYLAFCVLPKQGALPTPCGGGVNKSGIAAISYWISSNPPPYGVGLADEFLPGGRFTHTLRITPMIGKFDCRKVKCAITIRADHTREGDRSYDMFVPITFAKKK